MIRYGLFAVALIAACKSEEWKPRSAGVYVVTAPREPFDGPNGGKARTGDQAPVAAHIYAVTGTMTLQVQVIELPADVDPSRALAGMRNAMVGKATKVLMDKPADVGDVTGYDVTFIADMPLTGTMRIRDRFLFHDHHAYQVMAGRAADAPNADSDDADAKRFIESFAFTEAKKEVDPAVIFKAPKGTVKLHPHPPAPTEADGWVRAHSTAGRFSLRLPEQYIDAELVVPSTQVVVSALEADRGRDHARFLAYCKPTDGAPAADRLHALASSAANALPSAKATDLDVRGHPVTDLVDVHQHTRVIALPDRTCVMQVEELAEGTTLPTADAITMFDSLAPDEDHG